MRHIGTQAFGIRLPIISHGDDLISIVADSLSKALQVHNLCLHTKDVVGITEALVAKYQGNFASIDQIAEDIRHKFPFEKTGGEIGVVFPILSRNRFLSILKAVSRAAKKVHVLLQYPCDEVGNPVIALEDMDVLLDSGENLFTGARFREFSGGFLHPFTGLDYISLYEDVADNIEVHLSNDPRRIFELTKHVLVAEIHTRELTKNRLIKAGAETIYTLSDILSSSVNGSGYNEEYGVLGSNLSTEEEVKLFPRDCDTFICQIRNKIKEKCGIAPEILIYGDGAFKDPVAGIWELADPVVAPAYTDGLRGRPREIKIKLVADTQLRSLDIHERTTAITKMVRDKNANQTKDCLSEGTTPRNYSDLLGSLCDLVSGSGDKGTPVVLIQGYFDDYSSQ